MEVHYTLKNMTQPKQQCTLLSTVKHNAATVLWAQNAPWGVVKVRWNSPRRDKEENSAVHKYGHLLFFLHVIMQSRSGDISNIQDYFSYVEGKMIS